MITVTEDLPNCPACDAVAVKIGTHQRKCNTCGLDWFLRTAEDELDEEAERLIRTRGWNEDKGNAKEIRGMRW